MPKMKDLATSVFVVLASIATTCAQEAINARVTASDEYSGLNTKEDLLGSTASFGNADKVNGPKWAQFTSLGLGVWRLLLFSWSAIKFISKPFLFILHILHIITRPISLLIQLIYHLIVGVPFAVLAKLAKTLYPAYLFLGSAAIIGLFLGIGIALFSKTVKILLTPTRAPETTRQKFRSESLDPLVTPGKQYRTSTFPEQKRSPPSTRSILGAQPSLQTPTIFEESEASSYEQESDEDYNTDSDPGRSSRRSKRGYLDYKSIDQDGIRRRK